jgi:glycosyltransferase involved in cell wall biosynthesis/4-amino-4-deoxy-L-arabinose transferase-like glycosyltransferase
VSLAFSLTASVIVPVYNGEEHLGRCLDALQASSVAPLEIIVVDDGSTDRSGELARAKGVSVISTGSRSGPAHARNRGAGEARGDILVFIDADVAVHPDTLEKILAAFSAQLDLQALMGSYDDAPAERSVISLYKNLLHHYVHQQGRRRALTFWAGCGAVRRRTYLELGGMNETYTRPSIEDIEMGYRLHQRGYQCELHRDVQATHLKRWTLRSLIETDLFRRAVPWTELMLQLRVFPDDLNFSFVHKAGTLLALALPCLLLASIVAPAAMPAALASGAIFVWLNRDLYRLFLARGGIKLALAAVPLHLLYSLYCALGFGIGLLRHLRRSTPNHIWFLLAIVIVGAGLRLAHFWFIVQTPWTQHHLMLEYDDFMNYQWVQKILAGDWLARDTYHPYTRYMQMMAPLETWYQWWGGKEIFHQAPLYPYLLALLLGACQGSVSCVLLVQLCLGAIQPLILYALAARAFDWRAGLIAAALGAAYGPFIFYEGALLRDWLLPVVEALAVLLLLRGRVVQTSWSWLVAGCGLGLAILTRESALVLTGLAVAWVLVAGGKGQRVRSRAAVWVIVGILLSLSPLILRNVVVGAPPLAISNRFAEAIVASNAGKPFEKAFAPIMQESRGGPFATVIALLDSYSTGLIKLWLWKLRTLKDPFEIPNNVSLYYGQHISPVLGWALGYAVIFPLGLAGLIVSWPIWRRHSLLLLYGLATVIWLLVISPLSRYRLALVPVLIIFAAGFLFHLLEAVGQRNMRRTVGLSCLILISVLFQRVIFPLPEGSKHDETFLLDYWASARVYARDREYEAAAEEMGRLVSLAKGHLEPSISLAQHESDYAAYRAAALIEQGRMDTARVVIDQGVSDWLEAYERHGGGPGFPLFNFATLYIRLNENSQAILLLRRFLNLAPDGVLAARARGLLARLEQDGS